MTTLEQDIGELVQSPKYDPLVRQDFAARLSQGHLTRDENPDTHFSVYFLPFNPTTGNVFLVAHKKSGLWLAPGGHIDAGENLLLTLNRELHEELGLKDAFTRLPSAFFLSTVEMNNQKHRCHKHFDIWYLVETDGQNFHIDPKEFHETRWVNREQSLTLLKDPSNIQAVNMVLPLSSTHEPRTN